MKNISTKLNLALLMVILMALFLQPAQPVFNMEQIPIYSKEVPIPSTAAGSTYYVAKNGSDGDTGGWGDPWLTIDHAYTTVAAGDTVYIRVGTYNKRLYRLGAAASGTSVNWITYKAYNHEEVIIEEDVQASWNGIWWFTQQSYIRLSELIFWNASCFGVLLAEDGGQIHNITIDNCSFFNMSNAAIKSHGAVGEIQDLIIENNTLDDILNAWYDTATQEGISLSNTRDFEVSYNTIRRSNKSCIDIKSGSNNGTIHHNTINVTNDNPYTGLGQGIYIDGFSLDVSDVEIYSNQIWGNHSGIIVL